MKLIGKKNQATVIVKNVQGTTETILSTLESVLKDLGVTEVIIK